MVISATAGGLCRGLLCRGGRLCGRLRHADRGGLRRARSALGCRLFCEEGLAQGREAQGHGLPLRIRTDLDEAQPAQGLGEQQVRQRPLDLIPRLEPAQVRPRGGVAHVPAVIIPIGAEVIGSVTLEIAMTPSRYARRRQRARKASSARRAGTGLCVSWPRQADGGDEQEPS